MSTDLSDPKNTRYLVFRGEKIPVSLCDDGLWRTDDGTIIGFPNDDAMDWDYGLVGIFPFIFPPGTAWDDIARVHDYMYSSPAFQAFYTREDADRFLLHAGLDLKNPLLRKLARPFYRLCRIFGGRAWENKATRCLY